MCNLKSVDYIALMQKEVPSCIQVAGEVNIANIDSFNDILNRAITSNSNDLTIDFSKLTYIDSQGLNVLSAIYSRMKEQNRKIFLLNTNENIKKLLRILGLDKYLHILN